MVRQRPAKPLSPVRIRVSPPTDVKGTLRGALFAIRQQGRSRGEKNGHAGRRRGRHMRGPGTSAAPNPKRGEPVYRGVGKNSPLRRVGESRILIPALAGLAQLVARHLAKVEVAGSIPVARSIGAYGRFRPAFFISQGEMAKW